MRQGILMSELDSEPDKEEMFLINDKKCIDSPFSGFLSYSHMVFLCLFLGVLQAVALDQNNHLFLFL